MAPRLGGVGAPILQGDPNNGPKILCIDWAFYSVSTTIVALRLLTRGWITRNFGWDDITILLAQCLNTVGKAITIEEVANGLGQHQWNIATANYEKYLQYNYLDWCQVFLTLALSKISICLFLLRLSQFSTLRRTLHLLILSILLTHLPLLLLLIFQCHPVQKAWSPSPSSPGHCFSKSALEAIINIQGVISILMDFICAAFPIVLLRKARIEWRTKMALCALMGLGALTGVCCIVRTGFSWQVRSSDGTWVGIPNALARIAEVNLGQIAACAPLLKPFIRYTYALLTGHDPSGILQRQRSSRHRSSAFSTTTRRSPAGWHTSWYTRAPSRIFGTGYGRRAIRKTPGRGERMPVTAESAEWITARSEGSEGSGGHRGSRCESMIDDGKQPGHFATSFGIDSVDDGDDGDDGDSHDVEKKPQDPNHRRTSCHTANEDDEKDYYEEMAERLQASCSHLPSPYLGHRRSDIGAESDDARSSTSTGGGLSREQREGERERGSYGGSSTYSSPVDEKYEDAVAVRWNSWASERERSERDAGVDMEGQWGDDDEGRKRESAASRSDVERVGGGDEGGGRDRQKEEEGMGGGGGGEGGRDARRAKEEEGVGSGLGLGSRFDPGERGSG